MTLGNNRDYKTRNRRAITQLAKHAQRMKELMAKGMSKEDASKQALKDMEAKAKKKSMQQELDEAAVRCYRNPTV